MATISGRLGHTNPSFAMKTYIHETDTAEKRTAQTMDEVIKTLRNAKKAP